MTALDYDVPRFREYPRPQFFPFEARLLDIVNERHIKTQYGWRWVGPDGFHRWAYQLPQLGGRLSSVPRPFSATYTMNRADAFATAQRLRRYFLSSSAELDRANWDRESGETLAVVSLAWDAEHYRAAAWKNYYD